MTVSATYTLASGAVIVTDAPDVADCEPQQIQKILNHVAIGKGRFIQQYKNKPRMAAWLESYLVEVQAIEDAAFQVIDAIIDTSTGNALSKWGKLVGQENPGLSDDDYRVIIRARIRVNRSNGKPDDLIQILDLIAGALGEVPPVIMYTGGGTSYTIFLTSDLGITDQNTIDVVFQLIDEADTAGVGGAFVFGFSPTAELFRWSSSAGTVTHNGQGFESSVTPGNGGKFASARGSIP